MIPACGAQRHNPESSHGRRRRHQVLLRTRSAFFTPTSANNCGARPKRPPDAGRCPAMKRPRPVAVTNYAALSAAKPSSRADPQSLHRRRCPPTRHSGVWRAATQLEISRRAITNRDDDANRRRRGPRGRPKRGRAPPRNTHASAGPSQWRPARQRRPWPMVCGRGTWGRRSPPSQLERSRPRPRICWRCQRRGCSRGQPRPVARTPASPGALGA